MSDGARFPWKVQKPQHPRGGVTSDYSAVHKPLPPPPAGSVWHQDPVTKEYRLVKADSPRVLVDMENVTTSNDSVGSTSHTNEWELLSDRVSLHSKSTAASNVLVPGVGSVRSITTQECYDLAAATENASARSHNHSHGNNNSNNPRTFQRTLSNSTIDSQDNVASASLGPSGKGVLGVDYVEHIILPTDTLQGICIAYKISSTRLRQANHFSGHSLLLAPKKLVIPISKTALRSGFLRVQDTDAKEYKLYSFLAEFPEHGMTEAKAYLELADWVLKDALQSAREDKEWEREMDGNPALRAGEIRITMDKTRGCFQTQGAGIAHTAVAQLRKIMTKVSEDEDEEAAPQNGGGAAEGGDNNESPKPVQPISPDQEPAIATKTTKPQDIWNAAPQHNHYGVELQSFTKSDR